MVCCAIECNNVENHVGASIVLNAVYGCNGPSEPIFRCSNDHRNLLFSPVYHTLGSIWDKVHWLKPHNSWICKERTQGRYYDKSPELFIQIPTREKRLAEGYATYTSVCLITCEPHRPETVFSCMSPDLGKAFKTKNRQQMELWYTTGRNITGSF